MCECGCSTFNAVEGYEIGPYFIAFDIYFGCRDCATGLGIDIRVFTLAQASEMGLKVSKTFEPGEYPTEKFIPLFTPNNLLEAFKTSHEFVDDLSEGETVYGSLEYALVNDGLEIIRQAHKLCKKETEES